MNKQSVSVRLWTAEDFAAIQNILRETWLATYAPFIPEVDVIGYLEKTYNDEALLALFRSADTNCFIAEIGGQAAGFLRTSIARDEQRFYVSSLYVLPAFQSAGIGRRLMDNAIERALDEGFDRIYLGVMTENRKTLEWYRRQGFHFYREEPFTMGNTVVTHLIGYKMIAPQAPPAVDFTRYAHIIWDWNGTLFDDVQLCVSLINDVLLKRALPVISLERYRDIFTFPVREYYRAAGIDFEKESFEIVGREWMDNYEARKYECSLSLGALDQLSTFSKRGVCQSILSAYNKTSLDQVIEYFALTRHFTFIVGLDNIYAGGKADRGIALMQDPQLQGKKTALIGDTLHDFDVARELGVDPILVGSGHQSYEKLARCGAPLFKDMKSLFRYCSGQYGESNNTG